MTENEKITVVQSSDVMKEAVTLLYSLYKDCNLSSYIRYAYVINDEKYEITFLHIRNEIDHKPLKDD